MKKVLSSRTFQCFVCFAIGGTVSALLLPEKIVTKREVEVRYVDKVVEKEVIKEVKVVEEATREESEKTTILTHREIYPDGHIVEYTIFESVSEQIERISLEERSRYDELLAAKEREHFKAMSSLKVHTNPKNYSLFAGVRADPLNLELPKYLVGMQASVWGPFTIGILVDTQPTIGLLLGIRF